MSGLDRSTTAFQELIGSIRQHWANQLYPALNQSYQEAAQGQTIEDSEAAGRQVQDLPLYHWFCFIERHYQRMKYSDPRWGLAVALSSRPEWVNAQLHPEQDSRWLKLDPALASGTFVTTVTDVVGFFAFLGLATLVLL